MGAPILIYRLISASPVSASLPLNFFSCNALCNWNLLF